MNNRNKTPVEEALGERLLPPSGHFIECSLKKKTTKTSESFNHEIMALFSPKNQLHILIVLEVSKP